MNRGKFIVLEGLDGSGKTTQAKRLSTYLGKKNYSSLVTKEPTNSPIGLLIREILHKKYSTSPNTLALLYAADRSEHISSEVEPALKNGTHVICDRFVYSHLAYQGAFLPQPTIISYNSHSLITPDLTIFIDTSPEECTRRIVTNRKSLELFDGLEHANNLRANFFAAFEMFGSQMPVKIVNGNQSEDKIFSHLLSIVEELLS